MMTQSNQTLTIRALSEGASSPYITHRQLVDFATDHVNLKRDDAAEYRSQVNRLRDKLHKFINETPEFGLRKMLLNGSLAKGLALKTLNDIDVALYVDADKIPGSDDGLLDYLVDRLREAYPQMAPGQIQRSTHCVQITFSESGLKIDVAPVYALGDEEDHGYLLNKDTGGKLLTSIPRHLQFTRKRKAQQRDHYAQIVRFIKWWVKQQKANNSEFRMKSFMSEMIVAHLADTGTNFSDYVLGLERVFSYLIKSQLRQRIAFDDYYSLSSLPSQNSAVIEIYDPVNAENNVTGDYSEDDRQTLIESAEVALDAIAEARFATTKGRAVECWRRVLGPSFKG